MPDRFDQSIAVIGSGIAGLSCAWLLSRNHRVTLYEQGPRLGGHAHTVDVAGEHGPFPVDTGFIVYNEPTYPNLTALFRHLRVPTEASDMSFAASLDDGRLEYAGTGLRGLFGQPGNLFNRRFWSMLGDLRRLYAEAPRDPIIAEPDLTSLGDWLDWRGYGTPLLEDHLLPMAAAIWSARPSEMREYPAAAFFRFCDNHGLLRLRHRPLWRTVTGGSQAYVSRLASAFSGTIHLNRGVASLKRLPDGVLLRDTNGESAQFDHAVIATHADQALAMLSDADDEEHDLLGAFGTSHNVAVLHRDPSFMPKRRAVWASWNYIGTRRDSDAGPCVTYWMNNLQNLRREKPIFVTLNPPRPPRHGTELFRQSYEHPLFDVRAMQAQRKLWSLQGVRRTWFCGAWFGAGFHEDGLQAGLAVAEALGGESRPWSVPPGSARIHTHPLIPITEAVPV
jgi:predicted NAD/FAD-binding protein